MANVEFCEGIRCKKCGKLIVNPTVFTSELCQGCGTKLLDINLARKSYNLTTSGEDVTVKVTHKFFKDIYTVVEV